MRSFLVVMGDEFTEYGRQVLLAQHDHMDYRDFEMTRDG